MTSARQRSSRGATMVETALVLTILLMLVLGTIELGRAVWTFNTLAFATRQGIRYAVVRGTVTPATDEQIKSVIAANAVGVKAADLNVTTSWTPNRERGSLVEVRVTYPFHFAVSPLLGRAGTLNMRSTGTAVVAQ